jgi:organic radical activating enzyme
MIRKLLGKRYGLFRRVDKILHGGVKVHLCITMRCNLKCDYCCERFPQRAKTGVDFDMNNFCGNECSTSEIIKIIDNLFDNVKVPINEVVISGGEPTLRPDISNIVNHVLSKGCFVTLFTNFATGYGNKINNTYKFRIVTTFHKDDDKEHYTRIFEKYKKYHVIIEEIESNFINNKSRSKEKMKIGSWPVENIMRERLVISPDGQVFLNAKAFFEHFYGDSNDKRTCKCC